MGILRAGRSGWQIRKATQSAGGAGGKRQRQPGPHPPQDLGPGVRGTRVYTQVSARVSSAFPPQPFALLSSSSGTPLLNTVSALTLWAPLHGEQEAGPEAAALPPTPAPRTSLAVPAGGGTRLLRGTEWQRETSQTGARPE